MTEIPDYETILTTMQDTYRELAGFDADSASDIGIRLKVLARQLAALGEEIGALRDQVFPQTSTGRALDLHAQTRGLARKPALAARGVLRFSRETPSLNDITLPAGIVCATRPDPQVRFETTQDVVLPAGRLEVDVPAAAVDAGGIGNVAPGAVCLMITPAYGISAVQNPGAFAGGVDEESDGALRERLLESFQNISNGTNSAYYYDLAMKQEGVRSAAVLPRERGRGTVDVVISGPDADSQAAVAALQAELERQKEINVDVLVRTAQPDPVDVDVQISVDADYDAELTLAACERQLRAHADALGVGDPLLLARIGGCLFSVEGVRNYRVLSPAADLTPRADHIVAVGAIRAGRMAVS